MIKRPSAETAEAITVLQADLLRDQGITSVERLNTLTSNTPSLNIAQAVGTFTGGGTYADLRGLGNGRTLVLLDGQRLAPNAFSGNAVDLSGIRSLPSTASRCFGKAPRHCTVRTRSPA